MQETPVPSAICAEFATHQTQSNSRFQRNGRMHPLRLYKFTFFPPFQTKSQSPEREKDRRSRSVSETPGRVLSAWRAFAAMSNEGNDF